MNRIGVVVLCLVVATSCAARKQSPESASQQQQACDIAIAGGSTASLAAAITAAKMDANLSVCLIEMTDWPGGQLTSSGVAAIDFGPWNKDSRNLPASFNELVEWTKKKAGACWVSYNCFPPNWLVETYIDPLLRNFTNLKYFPRTVVKRTFSHSHRQVTGLECIQRVPTVQSREWDRPLSQTLRDWYSYENSELFTKTVINVTAQVFVEATEFGDVLATSGADFTQGAESPLETSRLSNPKCGLAATLPIFMELAAERNSSYSSTVPPGSDCGVPFPYAAWSSSSQWNMSWTYRRAFCNGAKGMLSVNVGDITQQNWVNDVNNAYIFLPMASNSAVFPVQSPWFGGVNLTAMEMLENRSLATFHFLKNTSSMFGDQLRLSPAGGGTKYGLSKLPYLRDSRRAFGIGGFRFTYAAVDEFNHSDPYTGHKFNDVVALGDYLYADMHKLTTCQLPEYEWENETKPYQIPFRALTVGQFDNLLTCGKTMAQTFHANAATRLHPSEWSSGVAAGAAAVLMARNGWATVDLLRRIETLQATLRRIGQPLSFTPPGPLPPREVGYACIPQLGNRCIGVGNERTPNITNSSVCLQACRPLGANEWLADTQQYVLNGTTITAKRSTTIKKSTATAITLPPSEKLFVCGGSQCELVTTTTYEGHYLCKRNSPNGQ